jgi:PBP1b-binding outer membrane lipoprotein LpoB
MRQTIMIAGAALLLTGCGGGDAGVANNEAAAAEQSNLDNELIDNPNGTQTLTLEGNDSATFVDGELVEVNRAE